MFCVLSKQIFHENSEKIIRPTNLNQHLAMFLFNMATFVLSHFQCHFAASNLKICRRNRLWYIKQKTLHTLWKQVVSNPSVEEVLSWVTLFSRITSVHSYQDIAAHCIFSLLRLFPHTAAPLSLHPDRSLFAFPSHHHRTWNIRSNDPTDSIDHWLKEMCHGQWQ